MTPGSEKVNTRELLDGLFFEASMATEKIQLRPDLEKTPKSDKYKQPDVKSINKKKDELSGILSALGIKDLADRFTLDDDGAFRLRSSKDQHKNDSDILFDLSKILPLVDKGYIAIDAEMDDKSYSILILSADALPEIADELPDSDDPNAVKFDNEESLQSEQELDLARQLVNKAINEVKSKQG
jgi:hypothetical protein